MVSQFSHSLKLYMKDPRQLVVSFDFGEQMLTSL